jgi:hypothetical protein
MYSIKLPCFVAMALPISTNNVDLFTEASKNSREFGLVGGKT